MIVEMDSEDFEDLISLEIDYFGSPTPWTVEFNYDDIIIWKMFDHESKIMVDLSCDTDKYILKGEIIV